MSTPSNSTSLITPSRSGAQGFRSRMLWETVKFNFALVGLGLGSESLAKLFRDDSPILTIVEPPPAASIDQPIFDEGLLEEGVIESPIAGGDKLQELRNALAGNLSEAPLISTITEPSPPTFLDEEPAEQTPVGTERALVDQAEQTDAELQGRPRNKPLLAPKEHSSTKPNRQMPQLWGRPRNKPLLTLQPMREIWRYGRSRQSQSWTA